MSDAELIARTKRGDRKAYETLVRQYDRLAFRTAYLLTGNAGDAEDAAQSAFMKAYLNLARFRADAPFRPWLLKIVANEARNARRASLRHRLHQVDENVAGDLPALDPGADLQLMARERSAWLAKHINALGESDRAVIHCRYTLELTENEMADVLGCARGTVKSRLSRALGRLRARLEADPDGYGEWIARERR